MAESNQQVRFAVAPFCNGDPVMTAAAMRQAELQSEDAGLSRKELMERAGKATADYFVQCYPYDQSMRVLVVCGNGNNGGDGFVIARLLLEKGYDVRVLLTGDIPAESLDAFEQYKRLCSVCACDRIDCVRSHTENDWELFLKSEYIADATHVIDAVYGIGFREPLPQETAQLFETLKLHRVVVLAVDMPSGLYSDFCHADPHTLPAHRTVTFTAAKPSLAMPKSQPLCGEVVVADLGISEDIVRAFAHPIHEITKEDVGRLLAPRKALSHKGDFGRLLSVCGSYGMTGAALLSGKAALRCGLGLLHMAIPDTVYPIIAGGLWEAVCHPMNKVTAEKIQALCEQFSFDAALVGCGLSQDPSVQDMLMDWLPQVRVPLILDADGLNFLAGHKDIRKHISAPMALTPHPKEAARLLGWTVQQVEKDRIAAVTKLAQDYRATVVLKGHATVIASNDSDGVRINTTGNSGLATGGSGDVLAGMIAAFAARGLSLPDAATVGVYLHGKAGDEAARVLSETALLPSDVIGYLPDVFSQFQR